MKLKVKALAMAAIAALTMSTTAQAAAILYTEGHGINTTAATAGGVTLAAGNGASGFSPGGGALATALAGGLGTYDAVVVGESHSGWDAAAKADLLAYTTAGGHAVVLGAHGAEVSFLSDVFGITVTAHSPFCSFCSDPISRVAGTGPATLEGLNGSWFLDDAAPLGDLGTILYTRDAGGVAAFNKTIGTGTLTWLAWDFCDCGTSPTSGAPFDGQVKWFSLLGGAAITPDGGILPEPGTLALIGLGVAGLSLRRRKVA